MKASKSQLAQIMQSAWAISKQAATKFGGSARQYLSGALKMAWQAIKNPVLFADNPIQLRMFSFRGEYSMAACVDTDDGVTLSKGDVIATLQEGRVINRVIAAGRDNLAGFDFYELEPDFKTVWAVKHGHVNPEEICPTI